MLRAQNALLKALKKGASDMLPLSFAVLPWGILFGSLAVQRGFDWLEAQLFSGIVFGGAVQIVTVELMANNASLFTVLFSAFVISSRHFLYGLALRERLSIKPLRWRLGLGFLLTDELFALSGDRRAYRNRFRLYYALGAGGSFYLAWNLWTFIGIFAGTSLPDLTELGLDFAIAATFIALVLPDIKTLASFSASVVAGVASVTFTLWEFDLSLVCAALLAMCVGFSIEKVRGQS
ncbi:MAG: 4-azaleucine resistance transporter AzlC [Porticoccaceae bacterium]|jgi:4-azaleucine resistance transporter AzlC|tara:strand:- start:2213 stop:2917 length:705 start_codon:yes stop_codon:yes gene_type:complete